MNDKRTPFLKELAAFGWVFFRFDGRVGREIYWLATGFLIALVGMSMDAVIDPASGALVPVLTPFGGLMLGLSVFSSVAVAAKRLHDVNIPGWFAILLAVPVLSLFFSLLLGILRGTKGQNRFGPRSDFMPRSGEN